MADMISMPSASVVNIDIGNYRNGSTYPRIQKIGRIRIVTFSALKNLTKSATITIGQVPSDSFPLAAIDCMLVDNANNHVNLSIRQDGAITAYAYDLTEVNCRGQIVYCV